MLHLNAGLDLNRPGRTLTAQFVFMVSDIEKGRRLNTYLEVKKPANKLDWKLQFRFDQIDSSIDTFVTVRYATGKAVTVSLFLNLPVTQLTNMEGRLNVTIPSFTPMCLEGKIRETIANDYDVKKDCFFTPLSPSLLKLALQQVDSRVVWFSGHEVRARGKYQDKSTRTVTDYSLKLLVQSGSFPNININAQYRRTDVQITMEVKVCHLRNCRDMLTNKKCLGVT